MKSALFLVLILALAGDAAATTWAKPPFDLTPAEAVEDMYAESDAVVIGRIERFESGMEPFPGGGFTWRRRLFVVVEQVLKGNTVKNRIELEPGNIEGLNAGSFERWRDQRTPLLFFLWDVSQRTLERKHPDSATISRTHAWVFTGRVPGYGLPVFPASSDVARFERLHSLESLAREADVVLLGAWEPWGVPCNAPSNQDWCSRIRVQRVLKGKVTPGLVTAFGRGFAVYPSPPTGALFFLRRQDGKTFEVLHLSSGVRAIRGKRLRQDGVSIDEAIARIQAEIAK